MIPSILIMLIAFYWLLKETNYLRVRLLVGREPIRKLKFEPMLCRKCYPNLDKEFAKSYQVPQRTIKAWGSTLNLVAGCNRCRAKLLRQIVTEQKRHTLPTYHKNDDSYYYNGRYRKSWFNTSHEPTIELLVDGKPITSFNGDCKRGDIKAALAPYTTRIRVGRKVVTIAVGEANRVKP